MDNSLIHGFERGEKVCWYRGIPGSSMNYRLIKATVSHQSRSKVAIQVMTPANEKILKYVSPEMLEKGWEKVKE